MPTPDLVQLIDNRLYPTREAAQDTADHLIGIADLQVIESVDQQTKEVAYIIVKPDR